MSDCIFVLVHVLCTLDTNTCNPERTSRADGGLPNSANLQPFRSPGAPAVRRFMQEFELRLLSTMFHNIDR
jgi:hypothetical protein